MHCEIPFLPLQNNIDIICLVFCFKLPLLWGRNKTRWVLHNKVILARQAHSLMNKWLVVGFLVVLVAFVVPRFGSQGTLSLHYSQTIWLSLIHVRITLRTRADIMNSWRRRTITTTLVCVRLCHPLPSGIVEDLLRSDWDERLHVVWTWKLNPLKTTLCRGWQWRYPTKSHPLTSGSCNSHEDSTCRRHEHHKHHHALTP